MVETDNAAKQRGEFSNELWMEIPRKKFVTSNYPSARLTNWSEP